MGFKSGELVSLVKVFRLFRSEWIFLGVFRESVDTVGGCTTSSVYNLTSVWDQRVH
jgi:hypothetical protein